MNNNCFVRFENHNDSTNPQDIVLYEFGKPVTDFKVKEINNQDYQLSNVQAQVQGEQYTGNEISQKPIRLKLILFFNFQVLDLLTENQFILDLYSSDNLVSRNWNSCFGGGDEINIQIKKPSKFSKYITSVRLNIYPYVPNQLAGNQNQNFENITLVKNFEDEDLVKFSIKVVPEYSYNISALYELPMGILEPSQNISLKGEIEKMMTKIGCYIRKGLKQIRILKKGTSMGP